MGGGVPRIAGQLDGGVSGVLTELDNGADAGLARIHHHTGGVADRGDDGFIDLRLEVAAGSQLHPSDAQQGEEDSQHDNAPRMAGFFFFFSLMAVHLPTSSSEI